MCFKTRGSPSGAARGWLGTCRARLSPSEPLRPSSGPCRRDALKSGEPRFNPLAGSKWSFHLRHLPKSPFHGAGPAGALPATNDRDEIIKGAAHEPSCPRAGQPLRQGLLGGAAAGAPSCWPGPRGSPGVPGAPEALALRSPAAPGPALCGAAGLRGDWPRPGVPGPSRAPPPQPQLPPRSLCGRPRLRLEGNGPSEARGQPQRVRAVPPSRAVRGTAFSAPSACGLSSSCFPRFYSFIRRRESARKRGRGRGSRGPRREASSRLGWTPGPGITT